MIFGKDVPPVRMRLLFCLLLLLGLLLCPLAALRAAPADDAADTLQTGDAQDRREWLIGTVAAAMAATCHPEALKAQAVAAASLADAKPETAASIAYWDRAARMAAWGDQFAAREAKLSAAVDAVADLRLTYDGKPAAAVWHSLSAGSTRSAADAWGTACPYLISVPSPGDRLSPAFTQEITVTAEAFAETLRPLGVVCDGAAADWVTAVREGADGYTESVTVCGKTLDGNRLCDAFDLPAAAFALACGAEGFTFTVHGSGHGVGMSQYGADYLARQGSDFRAILSHYYPGTRLESVG
ncbi:MAG: SpoIID/LytB domain-containing protein [Clostridia bacterium]|nr:SpoIID/LytB domain-containing protein [Clostridia bacterium]